MNTLLSIGAALPLSLVAFNASATPGPMSFTSEADSIKGTYQCPGGSTQTISVADQANTSDSGIDDVSNPSESFSACGKTLYSFTSVDDSTSASDATTSDFAESIATTGAGSLLGGLVTWKQSSNDLRCDEVDATDVRCTDATTITTLKIGGTAVPAGSYSPGTLFPISGLQILSSSCIGVELCSGTLTLLEFAVTGNHTSSVGVDATTMHLQGSSLCVGLPLGVTYYDLKVGGPHEEDDEDESEEDKEIDVEDDDEHTEILN